MKQGLDGRLSIDGASRHVLLSLLSSAASLQPGTVTVEFLLSSSGKASRSKKAEKLTETATLDEKPGDIYNFSLSGGDGVDLKSKLEEWLSTHADALLRKNARDAAEKLRQKEAKKPKTRRGRLMQSHRESLKKKPAKSLGEGAPPYLLNFLSEREQGRAATLPVIVNYYPTPRGKEPRLSITIKVVGKRTTAARANVSFEAVKACEERPALPSVDLESEQGRATTALAIGSQCESFLREHGAFERTFLVNVIEDEEDLRRFKERFFTRYVLEIDGNSLLAAGEEEEEGISPEPPRAVQEGLLFYAGTFSRAVTVPRDRRLPTFLLVCLSDSIKASLNRLSVETPDAGEKYFVRILTDFGIRAPFIEAKPSFLSVHLDEADGGGLASSILLKSGEAAFLESFRNFRDAVLRVRSPCSEELLDFVSNPVETSPGWFMLDEIFLKELHLCVALLGEEDSSLLRTASVRLQNAAYGLVPGTTQKDFRKPTYTWDVTESLVGGAEIRASLVKTAEARAQISSTKNEIANLEATLKDLRKKKDILKLQDPFSIFSADISEEEANLALEIRKNEEILDRSRKALQEKMNRLEKEDEENTSTLLLQEDESDMTWLDNILGL